MKKIFFLTIFVMLFCVFSFNVFADYVLMDSFNATDGTSISTDGFIHAYKTFTASSSYTLTQIIFRLKKTGNPSGTSPMYIYSVTSTKPDALLHTCTKNITYNTDVTTSFSDM